MPRLTGRAGRRWSCLYRGIFRLPGVSGVQKKGLAGNPQGLERIGIGSG